MNNIIEPILEKFNEHPDFLCVRTFEKGYTYSELNTLTEKYLHIIQNTTHKAKSLIAVYFSRSVHYIACIIAILESGSSFLPLDKEMPDERLWQIIMISGADFIVSDEYISINENMPPVIYISDKDNDLDRVCFKKQKQIDVIPSINVKDMAYVIFTSGSSGIPKGVMISHEALACFYKGFVCKIEMFKYHSILALTNFAFDISIVELLIPLALGMCIYLVDDKIKRHPKYIIDFIQKMKPEVIQLTPSFLMYLRIYQEQVTWLKTVKLAIIGGERVSASNLTTIKRYPCVKVVNAYGPTEATIWFSVGELTTEHSIHCGKPIDKMNYRIVNHEMGDSFVGELILTGPCLSMGYINDEQKTKEKFCFYKGIRYYRTGDIAKLDKDHNLMIIGRCDNQIKRFGHRIELEDIEENIKNKSAVIQCIVLLRGHDLYCYYVSHETLKCNDINSKLIKVLPNYMVPNIYTRLSKLRLNLNGKVDRKMISNKTHTEVLTTEIEEVFSKYIKQKYKYADSFIDIGISSIEFVTMLVELESKFEIIFDDEALVLDFYPDIQRMINYILEKVANTDKID